MSDDTAVAPVGAAMHFGPFGRDDLCAVRRFAAGCAGSAGLDPERADDVELVVNEAASNAIEHGGGCGVLRAWFDGTVLLIEVTSPGPAPALPADPVLPDPGGARGRGLWMMSRLTDRLEIRTGGAGTVVRMHLRP
jgi:anti-sigma regulatory factor (Ser/Thr protein kinase)